MQTTLNWTPASERLPEEAGFYFVIVDPTSYDKARENFVKYKEALFITPRFNQDQINGKDPWKNTAPYGGVPYDIFQDLEEKARNWYGQELIIDREKGAFCEGECYAEGEWSYRPLLNDKEQLETVRYWHKMWTIP